MNAIETHEATRDGIAGAGRSPGCREGEIGRLRREVASLRAALEGAALREARLSAELDAALRAPSHVVARPGGRFDLFDAPREAELFERAMRADGYWAEAVAVAEWTRHPGPAAGPSRGALRALALREPPRFGEPGLPRGWRRYGSSPFGGPMLVGPAGYCVHGSKDHPGMFLIARSGGPPGWVLGRRFPSEGEAVAEAVRLIGEAKELDLKGSHCP